ncbi:MAG: cell division protein SepF [Lachnospiraceae bacterium]|jgi:cell division inhibitor SepF
MGFLDNFLGKGLVDPEDTEEGYDDENADEDEPEEEEADGAAEQRARTEQGEAPRKKTVLRGDVNNSRDSRKVVPMHNPTESRSDSNRAEVCMVLPKGFENSSQIADTLLQGKTVVLNMEGMNIDQAQRIIDFTCGACYTMGGQLQKISKKIFIATPSTVELSGDFANLIGEDVDMSSLNLTV